MANNNNMVDERHTLQPGVHYLVCGNEIYLDMLVIFPVLEKFKQGSMQPLGIKSAEAFLASCKGLPYHISNNATHVTLQTGGRGVLKLSMPAMQAASIPVEMF
jgi:hypothetical protein